MSGHPHKGKRSEWFDCSSLPEIDGRYEYRRTEGAKVEQVSFVGWDWVVKIRSGLACIPAFMFSGQWRGLAERPE